MTVENASPDFPEYDGKTAEVWDRNAEWWDDQIGDGNAVQDLLEPITESMLELNLETGYWTSPAAQGASPDVWQLAVPMLSLSTIPRGSYRGHGSAQRKTTTRSTTG